MKPADFWDFDDASLLLRLNSTMRRRVLLQG